MKRYRDETGKLTMSIAEIAKATAEEAAGYYIDGMQYIVEGRPAVYRSNVGGLALFETADGYKTFVDPGRLGTFLPGVADDDLEIRRVNP